MAKEKTKKAAIDPPDVLVRVGTLMADVDWVRQEMGRPVAAASELGVTGAEPREVYFVAQAMCRKADRLCFEMTNEQRGLPTMPTVSQIKPGDVHQVVDAAYDRVLKVKKALRITDKVEAPARNDAHVPSDCFRAILSVNRQLNVLLFQQFAPEDVLKQVALAIGYAQKLLSRYPGTTALPDLPSFDRRKRPVDCYRKLGEVVDRLELIFAAAGLRMLDLTVPKLNSDAVVPSDVYDLASLVVSELAFIHSDVPDLAMPKPYKPQHEGRTLPSHVYQAAALLDIQLESLRAAIAENPSGLRQAGKKR